MNSDSFDFNERSNQINYAAMLELLPAYVLGALEPDEMLCVDEYIHQQKELIHHLEQLEETMGQFAFAAPQVAPPPRVKTQLMERIHQDLEVQQAQQVREPAPLTASAATPSVPTSPVARPVRKDSSSRDWRTLLRGWLGDNLLWPTLTVVATTAALVFMVYTAQIVGHTNTLSSQLEQIRQELTTLQVENQQLQSINDELQQQMFERENQLAIFSGATEVVTLEGTEEAPTASGVFYLGEDASLLVMRGLQPLSAEQIYELWLIPEEGAPVPAGLVNVDASGSATATLALGEQPANFAAVGVSIEPQGGSAQPTGPIVLLGTVKS